MMFNWLLRRRAHKIAVPVRRVWIPPSESKFYHPDIKPIPGTEVCRDLAKPPPVILRKLDHEDHYTCPKCGHTHIVGKGERDGV